MSRIVKFIAPNRAVLIAHIVATLALVVAAVAVLSVLLPFNLLGFRCGAPLLGAKVLHQVPITSNLFGQGATICKNSANHRLVTAIIVFVLALAAGVGGWVLPLGLPWWLGGEGGPRPRQKS
ncbi:MAG: hypothetical protein ACRDX8_04840 [Acidimicrobiales bacterium]